VNAISDANDRSGDSDVERYDPVSALRHSQHAVGTLFGPPVDRTFDVRYWDGTVEPAGRGPAPFTLVLRTASALRQMLLPPSELSVVESYLSGIVDVEGELYAALSLGDAIKSLLSSPRALISLTRDLLALPGSHLTGADNVRERRSSTYVTPAGHKHDRSRDRAAVSYHYDVGNDFYELWLDRRMVYSCAYFHRDDDTLDDAQEAKLDLVCRKLRLARGERFLDIGCGWGALVMHAAANYGVDAVGITLSRRQADLATQRIAAAGLSDSCRIELRDYRDAPAIGPFDKMASVGMIEHVGVDHLPDYFASAFATLSPGGLFLNHGIVSVRAGRPMSWRQSLVRRLWGADAFIDQYVFPDGKLGPFHAVIHAAEAAGFETRDVESLREHYARTLGEWIARLERCRDRALAIVGEHAFRIWRLYMTASERGFATGNLNVLQTLLSKPCHGRTNLPPTREDLFV
jgi:cyclopropane-fatty-acyl-phospholipid synthase